MLKLQDVLRYITCALINKESTWHKFAWLINNNVYHICWLLWQLGVRSEELLINLTELQYRPWKGKCLPKGRQRGSITLEKQRYSSYDKWYTSHDIALQRYSLCEFYIISKKGGNAMRRLSRMTAIALSAILLFSFSAAAYASADASQDDITINFSNVEWVNI